MSLRALSHVHLCWLSRVGISADPSESERNRSFHSSSRFLSGRRLSLKEEHRCLKGAGESSQRFWQQLTSVSGLEGLDVTCCLILLHSHLLPQRLCSHSVDDTVTDLQTAAHIISHRMLEYQWVHSHRLSLLVVPVSPVVWDRRSQNLGQHFSTLQQCIGTHLPPHLTPEEMIAFVKNVITQRSTCYSCWRHRPVVDAGPWRDEPTLATLAVNNQQPVSSHLWDGCHLL